jgi:hypothetical protein
MADVAYETVNVDYVSKSELSFSEYKKVPVLTVNGYQINDSAIIIKTLTPIIYGRPLSQVEQAQVDETTTKTMLAFEVLMFQSDKDIQKYLAKFSTDDGCMSWIFKVPLILLRMTLPRVNCLAMSTMRSPLAMMRVPHPPLQRACRA